MGILSLPNIPRTEPVTTYDTVGNRAALLLHAAGGSHAGPGPQRVQLPLCCTPYTLASLSRLHTYLPQHHRLKPGITGPGEGSCSHTLEWAVRRHYRPHAVQKTQLEYQPRLLSAVRPQTNHFTCWSPNFLICKGNKNNEWHLRDFLGAFYE